MNKQMEYHAQVWMKRVGSQVDFLCFVVVFTKQQAIGPIHQEKWRMIPHVEAKACLDDL